MLRLAILALLLPLPALAQTANQSPPPVGSPTYPSTGPSRLPLGAMRHEQPREGEVEQREQQELGPGEEKEQKRQKNDVDRLYDQLMRQSAPESEPKP